MIAQSFHSTLRILSLLGVAAFLAGCGGASPEETVTVKITGVPGHTEREEIQESLKTMTDGSSHSMSMTSSGGSMTVELSPVTDVQAFADKIDFGTVQSVDGRTVTVAYGDSAENEGGNTDSNEASADGGQPDDNNESANALAFESPQAAFDALNAAIEAKDAQALAAALTDESEQTMAGMLVLMAGFASLDETKAPEIEAILKKHGVDVDDDEKPDPTQGIAALAEPIRDKPAFIVAMMTWMDANNTKEGGSTPFTGTLEDVTIDGETAAGTVVSREGVEDKREPVEFRRVDGAWLVHLPQPQFGPPAIPPGFDNPPPSDFPDDSKDGPADKSSALPAPAGDGSAAKNDVSGTVFGREFKPDKIEFSQGNVLTMRQGEDFFADAEIKLFLFLGKGESPAGKSWTVKARQEFGVPHVHATAKKPDANGRTTEIYTGGDYRLTLSFSEAKNNRLTGKIDLVTQDGHKNKVSGTFHVELPEDPAQPPGERHKPFVHGTIDVEPKSEDWIRAGYVGVTAAGERLSNMVGTKTGPGDGNGWAESTTFKPRISRVEVVKDGPDKFRHVRLEPGNYFVYAKWGDEHLAGRWMEVTADSGLKVDFELNPEESGSLEVTVASADKQNNVLLLPLNEQGELPAAVPDDEALSLAFTLGLKAKVEGGTARFESLNPGRYRVFVQNEKMGKDIAIQRGATAKLAW